VYFKDGKAIEGTIVEENNETIVIRRSVGDGSYFMTTFSRGDIENIEKSEIKEAIAAPKQVKEPQKAVQKRKRSSFLSRLKEIFLKKKEERKPLRKIIRPGEVKSIHFRVNEYMGSIVGYVVFVDKEGLHACTNGTLTVYVKDEITEDMNYLTSISFKPEDFKFFTHGTMGEIFALPINLDPSKVKNRDFIEIMFMGNTYEGTVYSGSMPKFGDQRKENQLYDF
jgi:hypothetical protein